MERLLRAVQKLSLARDLDSIMAIVREEARELTGADGATFVLREGDNCYYAEENAIAPLWKGKHFPLEHCVSGWVMLNQKSVAIDDIYTDSRVPSDAYKPTFVKSMAMVPIRTTSPIGAIGNYWANTHKPSPEEMKLLEGLANSTSIAMENVRLYSDLEKRFQEIARQEEKERLQAKQLQEALYEKEALLKEIYHRVKNNLQIIVSLLNLQKESENSSAVHAVLMRSISRIRTMALVHELLYQSDNLASISMRAYIDELLQFKSEIYLDDASHIQIKKDIDEIRLRIEKAIPCGLILNELLSNAMKHGFPNKKPGSISLSLKQRDQDIILTVKDNGIGLAENIDLQQSQSLGMRLIYSLTDQLNGDIQIQRNGGTTFYLEFPA